jgi:hypothetical protein
MVEFDVGLIADELFFWVGLLPESGLSVSGNAFEKTGHCDHRKIPRSKISCIKKDYHKNNLSIFYPKW